MSAFSRSVNRLRFFVRSLVVITFILAGLLLASNHNAQAQDDELVLMYSDSEPYIISTPNGITGFLADYIKDAASQAAISVQWRNVPWSQQLETLKRDIKNICAPTLYKTPERETYMQFTAPVGSDGFFVLLGLRNNGKLARHSTFAGVAADQSLVPVVQVNTYYNQYIHRLLSLKDVPVQEGSVERLLRGQITSNDKYFIVSDIRANRLFEKQDLFTKYAAYSHFTDLMQENFHYIGCSLSTDASLFERLNTAIKSKGLALPD
ncbi:MAG: substrate-binding periplasmic protein [Kordiimonas sp.]